VFKGFLDGIGEGVLSGGRYDKLLAKMGRSSGGIGFAVYLDILESFGAQKRETDVDTLVLYDDSTDKASLIKTVQALVNDGASDSAQKTKNALRYRNIVDLTGGKV